MALEKETFLYTWTNRQNSLKINLYTTVRKKGFKSFSFGPMETNALTSVGNSHKRTLLQMKGSPDRDIRTVAPQASLTGI